jgi:hypothetical protein
MDIQYYRVFTNVYQKPIAIKYLARVAQVLPKLPCRYRLPRCLPAVIRAACRSACRYSLPC